MPRIHLVSNLPGVSALGDHLRSAGLGPTNARSADALLVLIDRPLDSVEQELLDRARQSVPVLLAGPTVRALPTDSPLVEASGFIPGRATPPHELRLLTGPDGGQLAARMGEFRPVDSWVIPDKVADDVQRLLLVAHELAEYPVCTWRPASGLGMFTLGTTASTLADPAYHRLVGRWLRHTLGVYDADPVGVGILGTPAPRGEYASAVEATEGLRLVAVSGTGHSQARAYDQPDELLADEDVRLVVVDTPNNLRSQWAGRALEAGKDVVITSPFALSTQEADDLALLAAARSSLLAFCPEHRDDPAYRGVRTAVRGGAVGELLGIELVQGGRSRPPGSWHDDERTSGGLIHDRAFSHLDWVLDLVDEPVEWVVATTHKRVWHHVTNADHARILLRFAGGAEAQLTFSDLLAVPTNQLRVLGTAGALSGAAPEADGAVAGGAVAGGAVAGGAVAGGRPGRAAEDRQAALPGGPLTLVTQDGTRAWLPLPAPAGATFFRDLADALLSGWPLASYRVETARRVVAVAEAATRSAAAGGAQIGPA